MAVQKITKTFYSVLFYGLLFLIASFSQTAAQTDELVYIVINGNLMAKSDTTLFDDPSTILGKKLVGETILELEIKPDSGLIKIISDSLYPVSLYIDDKIYEREVRFKNSIVEYKVGLEDDESGNKYLYISARFGNEIKYDKYDLLIAPAAVKIFKKFFGKSSKPDTVLRILRND